MGKGMTDFVDVPEGSRLLPQLIARVEAGEEITIARHGRPVARLVPFTERRRQIRKPGVWRGRIKIGDDFETLSEEEAREWYGR
jgi:prevent-host-death family protein